MSIIKCRNCNRVLEPTDKACPYCSGKPRMIGKSYIGALMAYGLPTLAAITIILIIASSGLLKLMLGIALALLIFVIFVVFSS